MSKRIFSYIREKRKLWQESAWLLGICENGFEDLKKGHIHWINNGIYEGTKWFADPFILDFDEQVIHLLVEEFDYKVHRGRIAKLTVDRSKWEVLDCRIVLDLPTHLSFPMIWKEGGDVHVCPENYASGGWIMYRYNSEKEILEYECRLSEEKLTDATLYNDGTNYWLFSTYDPHPNGAELTIWKSDLLYGPYRVNQHVQFSENTGRNAGMMFRYNSKLMRPAQESNSSYGHSMVFQEVSIDRGIFTFKEVFRFYSPHKEYNAGTHTYNTMENMAVVDVKGWRYPRIAKILMFLSKVFISLHLKKPYLPQ